MKLKIIPLLLFSVFFYACNNGTEKATESHVESASHDHENHEVIQEERTSLSLNNGEKWKADESTNLHAEKLISKVNTFNSKESFNLPAYQNFALDMQMELNSLIKDCKMSGPDHDALHYWLEPVLQNINHLTKATTDDDAQESVHKLTENVLKYNQYFN